MSNFVCNCQINEEIYRCSTCVESNGSFSGSLPPLWVRQKKIQKTNGVSSSEYIMNLGSLTVYQSPDPVTKVNWNQSSDQRVASVNLSNNVPSHGNSTKTSLTRARPGSCAPGGVGVDIKHNSYARYLARIKGKAPLRKQGSSSDGITTNTNQIYKFNIVRGVGGSDSCACSN